MPIPNSLLESRAHITVSTKQWSGRFNRDTQRSALCLEHQNHFGNLQWRTSVNISITVTTSGTGSFSLSFKIPNDKSNAYVVTVKDALGYVANTVYTIT